MSSHHTQEVKVEEFNTVMMKSNKYGNLTVRFDGSNHTGVFKVVFRKEHFYYVCTQAEQTPASLSYILCGIGQDSDQQDYLGSLL
jgi:hypothetical protein